VPHSQEIIDLALAPTPVLGCERIDAGIHTDVANKKRGTLDKMRYLIHGAFAKATCRNSHRCSPSPPGWGVFNAERRPCKSKTQTATRPEIQGFPDVQMHICGSMPAHRPGMAALLRWISRILAYN
jgi:hypothetical protein